MCQHEIKVFLAGIDLIQVIDFLNGMDILKFGFELKAMEVIPVGGAETARVDVVGQSDGLSSYFLLTGSTEGSPSWGVGCLDLLGIVRTHGYLLIILIKVVLSRNNNNSDIIRSRQQRTNLQQ